ncbi:MAG: hypothetical protein LBT89_00630 [Planctomycetaceae bacterium]|jgi:hypothetical protein|nr:hypothetical protein [Planctomycetaceae bacterium]
MKNIIIAVLLAVHCPFFAAECQEVSTWKVGIENCYKNGLWTPLHLELTDNAADKAEITVRCSDADGAPIDFHAPLNGNQATVYIRPGRQNEKLQVLLPESNIQRHIELPPPVRSEKPVYLIIGSEDIGLQGAVAELALREDRRPLLVKVKSAAELPTVWFGYDAVDMVVLTTTEPQFFEGMTSESPQIRALDAWVKLGGTLFFAAGQESGKYLETPTGALYPFLPGKFAAMTELRQGTPFEHYINSKRPVYMTGTQDAPFMKMPRFTGAKGITLVKDGDCPLVLRAAHGFGTLIYFGGDLSGKPLATWRDRVQLVTRIMQWDTSVERKRSGKETEALTAASMLQLGYNDISGQIRSALDKHSGTGNVPFSVILIILTVYWLFIGIGDWFVVRKLLNRPMLTWLTFPLWIVLFSVLAYSLTVFSHPNQAAVNELNIIDIDGETGLMRSSTWVNVYSPNDALYSVSVQGGTSGYLSYFGLSGSGFGGMAPKTVSPNVWKSGSVQQNGETLENVPVQIRSTKSFFGESSSKAALWLTAKLSDEEGILVGTVTAPESMPELEDALLVYGRWVLELGSIKASQTLTLDKKTPRREMRSLLLSSSSAADEQVRQLAAYNPQSDDLGYVVRVLTLHRALGGYESAGLHHTFQSALDMSGLLTADRAVLLGKIKTEQEAGHCFKNSPAMRLRYADASPLLTLRSSSFFRQPLPITLTALSPRLKIEQQHFKADELEQRITPAGVSGEGWKLGQ